MKVDIFGWVRDALEENGIKIKAIERDNTCGHFELDFSVHDAKFVEEIENLEYQNFELNKKVERFESRNVEKEIEEIKSTLKENNVLLKNVGNDMWFVDFSKRDKVLIEKIEESARTGSEISKQKIKLERKCKRLMQIVRLLTQEEEEDD